jgi:hypothetical protein
VNRFFTEFCFGTIDIVGAAILTVDWGIFAREA